MPLIKAPTWLAPNGYRNVYKHCPAAIAACEAEPFSEGTLFTFLTSDSPIYYESQDYFYPGRFRETIVPTHGRRWWLDLSRRQFGRFKEHLERASVNPNRWKFANFPSRVFPPSVTKTKPNASRARRPCSVCVRNSNACGSRGENSFANPKTAGEGFFYLSFHYSFFLSSEINIERTTFSRVRTERNGEKRVPLKERERVCQLIAQIEWKISRKLVAHFRAHEKKKLNESK